MYNKEVLWLGDGSKNKNPSLTRIHKKSISDNIISITTKLGTKHDTVPESIRNVDESQRYLILGYNQLIKSKENEKYFNVIFYGDDFKKNFEVLLLDDVPELVKVLSMNKENDTVMVTNANNDIKNVSVKKLRSVSAHERYIIYSFKKMITIKIGSEIYNIND